MLKKLFVFTIVFSMMVMAMPTPKVGADDFVAGDLIKSSASSAVYYYDGTELLVFPHEKMYFTYYEDWSGVQVVSTDDLAGLPFNGKHVTVRPGTYLIKVPDFASVYAVESGGVLRHVADEATAITLWGDAWASTVIDVGSSFFSAYDNTNAMDNPVIATAHPAGSLIRYTGSDDIYYIDAEGQKRLVTEDGFTVNFFNEDYVVENVADTITYTDGTSITIAEADLFPIAEGDTVVVPPVVGGDLTVALASGNPASATIPSSATGVVFMEFSVTAGDEDAVLKHITVKREDIGATTDLSKVYIYEGSNRLTSGKTINSTTNKVKFSSVDITVSAGSTKTLSVVCDIAESVSGHHKFLILSADDVELEGGSTTGTFPISGNTMSLSATNVGTLTATQNNGTGAVTMRIGEDDKEIADFDFDNTNVEDVKLDRIVLTNGGNAQSGNLGNVRLIYDGAEIAIAELSSNKLVFEFDPITIDKGDSNVNFKVRGDIESGITNTVKLYIANSSDVVAVGQTYGYNSAVTITDFDASGEAYPITISGSEINVNLATDNAETIMADQNDFVFGSMEVNVSADVDVITLVITMDETDGGDTGGPIDIDELQLYNRDTEEYIDGTVSGTNDATANDPTWTFANFTWNEGEETWDIIGDIPSTASTSDSYKVTVDLTVTSGTFVARYQASNDEIADTDISTGTLTGKTKTIGGASLTVMPASFNPGDAVANDIGVVLAGGTFEASNISDISITEVAFHGKDDSHETDTLDGDDDDYFDKTNVGTIKFLVDGVEQDSKGAGSLTNGAVTFDGFDVTVPANGSVTFSVELDVAGTLDATSPTPHLTERIQMTSVTAKDNNNDSVDAIDGIDSAVIVALERLDFGRVVTLHASGQITLSMDNTVDGVDADKYILAGTSANKLARVKIKAEYEDVKITQLVVATDNADTYRSVTAINITDADGTVLATKSMVPGTASSTATFSNDNGLFTLEKGTDYYYVTVDLATQGDGATQTAETGDDFDVYIEQVLAQGAGSGVNMTAALNTVDYSGTGAVTDVRTAAANDATVVGVRISAFTHDTSVSGYDNSLTPGEEIVFAFKVTTEDTDNASSTGDALKAVLETVVVKATYYRTTITTTDEFRLYRQGKTGYVSSTVAATGSKNEFDLTNTSNGSGWSSTNYDINPGDSAIFYVKAINIDSALAVDYIQMKIVDLDGTSGGSGGSNHDIMWDDDTGTHMYDLRLGEIEITGHSVHGSGS